MTGHHPDTTPTAITVGTFDGVHLGHCEVLDTLGYEAMTRRLRPVAVTFDRHPLQVVAPQRAPRMLTTRSERDSLIRRRCVGVCEVPFTPDLARLSAYEWMQRLHDRYSAHLLVVGYDNTFGHDGASIPHHRYVEMGHQIGIEVIEAPCLKGISSSAVRKAVMRGDVSEAMSMLGRPFSIQGNVGEGKRIGRTIGFPTANVMADPMMAIPANGVYAAYATTDGDDHRHMAMVNIGNRPTIGQDLPVTIEANLIGFDGNLYGRSLRLHFMKRLRDERRFSSLDDLRRQLDQDRRDTIRTMHDIWT